MPRPARNYEHETRARTAFIQKIIAEAGACGIVYGNSGGKDCALAGALCKLACPDTVGIIIPCIAGRNNEEDVRDAYAAARLHGIETRIADLSGVRDALLAALDPVAPLNDMALINIPPRLRMTTLYAVAASENRLVAGTGNRSERHMGYFTKWGDGAFDFNPIADLTVTEVYEFLAFLGAPPHILEKAPSAGLYEGQTDEGDMGVSYASIDAFLAGEPVSDADRAVIERYHKVSGHKRRMPPMYGE